MSEREISSQRIIHLDEHSKKEEAASEQQFLQLLRIQAIVAGRSWAPPVIFQCPKRHYIVESVLSFDRDGRPYLGPIGPASLVADDQIVGENAEATTTIHPMLGDEKFMSRRIRFSCDTCGYSGLYSRIQLLKLYAVAEESHRYKIRLSN